MCLLVERFEANQTVFKHGELGTKFYIILEGSVGVDIPIKSTVPLELL